MRAFVTFAAATATALAAGPAGPGLASATSTALGVPGSRQVARYDFDAGLPDGTAADGSGRGGTLRVVSRAGGVVAVVPGVTGQAVAFPARCGGDCPRAILQGRDDDALDPGSQPIRYGAVLRLRAEQATDGSNVVQKGNWSSNSEWKLQVDGYAGRPSCAMKGSGSRRVYLVTASVSVADGGWHQVTCERSRERLRILVDGTARGQLRVPAGLAVSNSAPLLVGGNAISPGSDRFHGAVDNVFVEIG
jgi:concanavalin A-like lectin/glucanase superfamily protein